MGKARLNKTNPFTPNSTRKEPDIGKRYIGGPIMSLEDIMVKKDMENLGFGSD